MWCFGCSTVALIASFFPFCVLVGRYRFLIIAFLFIQYTYVHCILRCRRYFTKLLNFLEKLQICPVAQKQGKRKLQGGPQSQIAALPRHQEEEQTDKSKQAQIEQTYEKH